MKEKTDKVLKNIKGLNDISPSIVEFSNLVN